MGSSGILGFIRICAGGRLVPAVFTRVRAGGCWIHSGSLGSLGFALGALGSSEIVGFTWVRAGGHWVLPGSFDSLGFTQEVVWFIWGHRVH